MQKIDIERLMAKTAPSQGCWRWMGGKDNYGYGRLKVRENGKARYVSAHRAFYTTMVGEIPEGLTIDHLCRNKICVNPEHLEAVTRLENVRRYYASVTFLREDIMRMSIPVKLVPLVREFIYKTTGKHLPKPGERTKVSHA